MPEIHCKGSILAGWRIFGASHQGLDHIRRRAPCEDAFEYGAADPFVWMAVADGLGSERFSGFGARLAVDHMNGLIGNLLASGSNLQENTLLDLIEDSRRRLIQEANARRCDPRQFSTTMQVAIIDTRESILRYAVIGDGHCIVSIGDDRCIVIGDERPQPSIGTAHLLHDDYEHFAYRKTLELPSIEGVLVFTDGLDDLLLEGGNSLNSGERARAEDIANFKSVMSRVEDEARGIFVLNTLVSARQHETLKDDKTLVIAVVEQRDRSDHSTEPAGEPAGGTETSRKLPEELPAKALSSIPSSRQLDAPAFASKAGKLWTGFHRRSVGTWIPWLQLIVLLAILCVIVADRLQPFEFIGVRTPPAPIVKVDGLRQISSRVYIIPDNSVPSVPNVGYVVGDRAVLVIDTGLGPPNGAVVYEVAKNLAGTKPLYLVTTQVHPEHDLGAQAFPGTTTLIRSVGQSKDIAEFGRQLAKTYADRSAVHAELLKDADFRKADITFEHSHDLDLGGVRAKLLAMGPNQRSSDTVIWIESERVLFAGDLAMRAQPEFASPHSSLRQWLANLDGLEALKPALIVPSHGPTGEGSSFITGYRAYLIEIRDRTTLEKRIGRSVEQAVQAVTAAIGDRVPDKARLAGAIRAAYAEAP